MKKPKIWALADPHLGHAVDKPMGIFGEAWENHAMKIAQAWRERVDENDYVLLPGDISWAMTLEEVAPDLRYLHELPGTKILGKGNHDYWWDTLSKNERLCEEEGFDSIKYLYNNALRIDLSPGTTVLIVGTRAWDHPSDWKNEHDEKIYRRELGRFELSVDAAKPLAKAASSEGREIIRLAMLHYPVLLSTPQSTQKPSPTPFHQTLVKHSIAICLYGHLHGKAGHYRQVEGEIDGVRYMNVAADAIRFTPQLILDGETLVD